MQKLPLFTFIVSLFLLQLASNAKETPDMIVVLTRHGAREPYNSAWDKSWANSQEVVDSGVEQSYILGAVLAEAYADLLKDIDMKEVTAYATVKARTEMTVSAVLLGLFQGRSHDHKGDFSKKDFLLPYTDQDLVNKVIDKVLETPEIIPNRMQLLHQILTTYKADKNDTFEPLDCWLIKDSVPKRFNDEVNPFTATPLFLKNDQNLRRDGAWHSQRVNNATFAELNDTVTALRKLGYPIINLQELVEDADIMISRFSDNKPPLEGIPYDGKIYKDMIYALHWWCLYNFIGPEIERSVRVYPLYRNMISWFNDRVSGERKTKVILIGGHESAMFPFLDLHGIVNHTCFHENYKAGLAGKALPYPDCVNPDFSSQLIYELYDSKGKNPYVKMLYNGKPFKICPESEGVECSLSEFERLFPGWTSNLAEEEYQGLCVEPGSEVEREAKATKEEIILMKSKLSSELEKCQAESTAKAGSVALKLESQKMRDYLPIVTGLLGVVIGLLPYCLGVVKGRKIYEYAKRTGLTLLAPRLPADVLTHGEESCGEQNSGIMETKQKKMKKEIVDV